jgi:hypothetical protein
LCRGSNVVSTTKILVGLEDDLTKRLMTKQDGVELKADLRTEMHGFKTEIIKWMFLFWIGQTVATAAIVKLLVP